MSIPPEFAARLADFPPALHRLISEELAAGNSIVEIASCFPAPPAGAYVMLAREVTTRLRASTTEIEFRARNSSLYSGEWCDARRFYFVIEPPRPPPPEPDMEAIRAASNASRPLITPDSAVESTSIAADPPMRGNQPEERRNGNSVVERFRASMIIDYEKWHDGIGYDVALLENANGEDRRAIESILLNRGVSDWRDVEALAALWTDGAKRALKRAMVQGKTEIRAAILRLAPTLVSEDDKISFLVEALRTAQFYGGLSQALDEVAAFHPPEIVDALFDGVLRRRGEVAIHFAAMILYIHGRAKAPFDWEQRPFCLRFDAAAGAGREEAFQELCDRVGVDPEKYLGAR